MTAQLPSAPVGAGASNETILFEARYSAAGLEQVADLVLRVSPAPEYRMFLDPEFEMQYELLSILHRLGSVKVPEMLWFEADPVVLGRPSSSCAACTVGYRSASRSTTPPAG
ncbi:hypothetical protein BBK14_26850 [Parafrankia soli]|uniref:Aminoglycoside phosphotransferase domain-containing protein n=1 Tax=Parafrankia soli TaxID=2599596 RepID=A0A1S1PEL2_9ACTN|nr:hypothetical protein [Parafrankia soli]OHV21348.1 hypothetical protein BBK14_26850 [Parafrankia soli]